MVFPVGLPDTGYFDWVDGFLERHPDFEEVSDRRVADWALGSGVPRPRPQAISKDKPLFSFGIRGLEDGSVGRVLGHLVPTSRKNVIIPELQAPLRTLLGAGTRERGPCPPLPWFTRVPGRTPEAWAGGSEAVRPPGQAFPASSRHSLAFRSLCRSCLEAPLTRWGALAQFLGCREPPEAEPSSSMHFSRSIAVVMSHVCAEGLLTA